MIALKGWRGWGAQIVGLVVAVMMVVVVVMVVGGTVCATARVVRWDWRMVEGRPSPRAWMRRMCALTWAWWMPGDTGVINTSFCFNRGRMWDTHGYGCHPSGRATQREEG